MIYFRTGLQGASKTLNTIKEVDAIAVKENRPVYYCNITEFDPNHSAIKAEWHHFDDPKRWFDCPQNAIIVIDEAQQFFRNRKQGSDVPEYCSRLEIMRKDGHDLHLITQAPSQVDVHMRKLCFKHVHYSRQSSGKLVTRWEFSRCNLDVEKKEFFAGESSKPIIIDKSFFGCYKSVNEGTDHHRKFKLPRAGYFLLFLIPVLGYVAYGFADRRLINPEQLVEHSSLPQESFVLGSSAPIDHSPESFIKAHLPRIESIPSSAPAYDHLTKPVTYPKLFCVSTTSENMLLENSHRMTLGHYNGRLTGCRCNTQQGTRASVSFDACMTYVTDGIFDPAKPDKDQNNQMRLAGSDGERRAADRPTDMPFAQPDKAQQVFVSGITNTKGAIQ